MDFFCSLQFWPFVNLHTLLQQIGFEPLSSFEFTGGNFLDDTGGHRGTEQDKVKLETDDAVEDAALEAEEADCKEKKGAWHLFS